MSLPDLAIRRPVFAWMWLAAILLFGVLSFSRLGLSLLPDVDQPNVYVELSLPGASPAVMESQVLDQVEDAVMELDGISWLESEAVQGSGWLSITFDYGRDIDQQMQQVQNKLSQIRYALPINLRPPSIRKRNPEDQPILWLALGADDPKARPLDLMLYARDVLYNQFATVPGVANIALSGFVGPALRVWVDQDRLDHFNVTADDLVASLKAEHIERPAGRIENARQEANVRVLGEAATAVDFARIQLQSRVRLGPSYRSVRLDEVARVEEGLKDVRNIARYNGQRVVGLGIIKQHGGNSVEIARLVQERLQELRPLLPPGFHLDLRSDDTRFVRQAVEQLLRSLAFSVILTALVTYLFLGSASATLNVMLSVPAAIVGAFTALYFFHFTLNTFTLLALSLAIGIVVDDAILVLENIVRFRELGEARQAAARKGAGQILFAAIASTVAVVAIFLPMAFVDGIVGRYFFQFGVTVSVAVVLSLVASLTITPMFCSRHLRLRTGTTRADRFFTRLTERYRAALDLALRHRWSVLLGTALFFAVCAGLATLLPTEMVPPQDQSMIRVRYQLPLGSSIGVTDRRSRELEEFLRRQPEVVGVLNNVGGWGGDAVNSGNMQVSLVPRGSRKMSQRELMDKWRESLHGAIRLAEGMDTDLDAMTASLAGGEAAWRAGVHRGREPRETDDTLPFGARPGLHRPDSQSTYSGMRITFQDLSMRIVSISKGSPVEFLIQGPDADRLAQVAEEVMSAMRHSPYFTDVEADVDPPAPEVGLVPDRHELAKRGLSLRGVTNTLNALVVGYLFEKENSYAKTTHRIPVILRLRPEQRSHLGDLARLSVRNSAGEAVRLGTLFQHSVHPGATWIYRVGRSRAIEINANVTEGYSQDQALGAAEKLARSHLPAGYSVQMSGSARLLRQTFRNLGLALLFGVLVSYMVLATQFNSFVHPISVLAALPFGLSGALLSLLAFRQSINIYSFIGLVLLLGIAKKNSILLVAFTNDLRQRGLNVREALLGACPVRLRPILLTTLATIAAALPEAMPFGAGSETTVPMALVVIGGVIVSTLLTLFVVPCVYSVLAHWERSEDSDGRKVRVGPGVMVAGWGAKDSPVSALPPAGAPLVLGAESAESPA